MRGRPRSSSAPPCGFAADIAVAVDGREADAKSLLAVLALGAKGGTSYG